MNDSPTSKPMSIRLRTVAEEANYNSDEANTLMCEAADEIERLTREHDATLAKCNERLNYYITEQERLRAALVEAETHHQILHPECYKELAGALRAADETECRHGAAKAKGVNEGLDSVLCECGVTVTADKTTPTPEELDKPENGGLGLSDVRGP